MLQLFSPAAQELFPVLHCLVCQSADQTYQSANLLPSRVALLLSQYDTRMAPAGRCPFRVDLMVIPNIERIESPASHRSETEVLFVLPADHAGVGGR